MPEKPEEPLDAYDRAEGFPVEVEDIAIVAHEACRAYRQTQGGHTTKPWMHAGKAERSLMVQTVQGILGGTEAGLPDDEPEDKLIIAVVKALRP